MSYFRPITITLGVAVVMAMAWSGGQLLAQGGQDPNAYPNPYTLENNWAKLPEGRKMGQAIGVEVDKDGKSLWVFDRCGGNDCGPSPLAPIMKFDPTGKHLTAFGWGMFNFPHGLAVDRDGNVYVTDGRGKNGKGDVMVKFSPEGRVLMTFGKPGMPGSGSEYLDQPSDVVVAPNGDIYIADGHGGNSNDRVVKLDKTGKFITAWAKHGKGSGELDVPHGISIDSQGRIFVADRANSRVVIFDGNNGRVLAEWKQFGRPSSVFVDKNDVLYVADSQSNAMNNPGFKQGIRIGSAKDGRVTAFIPDQGGEIGTPEAIGVDDQGIIYGGYTQKTAVRRFVKK